MLKTITYLRGEGTTPSCFCNIRPFPKLSNFLGKQQQLSVKMDSKLSADENRFGAASSMAAGLPQRQCDLAGQPNYISHAAAPKAGRLPPCLGVKHM